MSVGSTVKIVLAALVPSEPVTEWPPWKAIGTVNEQLTSPTALLVAEQRVPLGFQLIVTLAVPAKPVPVAVTEVPTWPLVGAMETSGRIEKVAVAELAVGEAESVPVTVWLPATACGAVKLQEKLPREFVVAVHRVAPPGDQLTVTAEAAANPKPVAVIEVVPTTPLVVPSVRLGSTFNVALAVFEALSVAVVV